MVSDFAIASHEHPRIPLPDVRRPWAQQEELDILFSSFTITHSGGVETFEASQTIRLDCVCGWGPGGAHGGAAGESIGLMLALGRSEGGPPVLA